MAELKNPLQERVAKMAAILAAAKEVSEELKKEKEAKGETGKASLARPVAPGRS